MSSKKNHPVWEVYDLHRTCRNSEKYWSTKYIRLHKVNFWLEYSLLATAPSSAIAGLVFWSTTYGKIAWSILAIFTASLAVAKPLLKFSEKLEKLKEIVTQYRSVEFQLSALGNDIRRQDEYSSAMVTTYKNLVNQVHDITEQEPIERINKDLQNSCYNEVNRELPITFFYEPSK